MKRKNSQPPKVGTKRRQRLSNREICARRSVIRYLRNQDFSNPEIADKLKCPIHDVASVAHQLIQAGQIEKRKAGRKSGYRKETKQRDQEIIRLCRLGLTRQEMADHLKTSYGAIAHSVSRLLKAKRIRAPKRRQGRPKQPDAVKTRFDPEIIRLREAGWQNAAIADGLKTSVAIVGQRVTYLIKHCQLQGRLPGRKGYTRKEKRQFDAQIVELRASGYDNESIADILKVRRGFVVARVHYLIKKRVIESLTGQHQVLDWSFEGELVQTIIRLKKKRATQEEIAQALGGVSGERARQMVVKVADLYGEGVFKTESRTWLMYEVARELGTGTATIRELLESGEIPFQRRGHNQRLIGEEGMRLLRAHPRIMHEKTCRVCQKKFPVSNRKALTCSADCRKKYSAQQRDERLSGPAALHSLRGWLKELYQRLQHHVLPPDERWVLHSEAKDVSGLTAMQVSYLQERQLVATRPSPDRLHLRTGAPINLYSASQMILAGQVYREYGAQEDVQ